MEAVGTDGRQTPRQMARMLNVCTGDKKNGTGDTFTGKSRQSMGDLTRGD